MPKIMTEEFERALRSRNERYPRYIATRDDMRRVFATIDDLRKKIAILEDALAARGEARDD